MKIYPKNQYIKVFCRECPLLHVVIVITGHCNEESTLCAFSPV